jgi:signal transduction histidine kinase
MRLAFRTILILVLSYGLAVFGLFLLVDHMLEKTAWKIMEQTTQVLGSEIGSALTDPILQKLLSGRRGELRQLSETVFELVRRSEMVRSATLVDAEGEAVAVTGTSPSAKPLPTAGELFATDLRPRLVSTPGRSLSAGYFLLDVPLVLEGKPMAYLRLTLGSSRIGDLYEESRRVLLLGAGASLLLIGALGFGLHLQIARRERLVVRTLEGALEGKSLSIPRGEDDLGIVADMAGRLGAALHQERSLRSAAQQSMAQLEQLLEVGVVLADADGSLLFAGSEARELLALTGAEEDAQRWNQTLTTLRPGLHRARDGKDRVHVDLEGGGPTGRLPLRCHIHAIGQQDSGGYIVLVRDRSVLLALETDLRQAVQLRGLTRLYRGVAHDLKAPLNAMVLNLELLKQSLSAPQTADPEERSRQRGKVEIVEEELARLGRALETLLSQTAPARPLSESERFDLRALVEETERLLAPQARQQHVDLRVEAPSAEIMVTARRDALKQAILNLAINGLEAMPQGGALSLASRTSDSIATLAIQDSGPGIPESVRPRIFELHVTTKASGTGIGLYVARAVVEADGGSLRLVSTGAEGTVFEMTLPLAHGVE